MNLTETLREPEGKTLEFKRDLSSPERFLRTVVAFANTSGGTILVGIEDRSRHIRGVTEPLALEERAVNLISDSEVDAHKYRYAPALDYPSGPVRPDGRRAASLWSGPT